MKHPTPHFDPPTHQVIVPVREMEYVGFRARFVAFLIDLTMALVAVSPLVWLLAGGIDLERYDPADPAATLALVYEITLRLSFIVAVIGFAILLFWILRSATPGKMAISSIILRAEDGGKPRPGQLIIRCIGYFISLTPLGLGFLWIAFNPRKQGWHDMFGGTVVVRKPARSPNSIHKSEDSSHDIGNQ
jgi:uncharacterized RDD family membrane protein YckC